MVRVQRLQDPIHGLIKFDSNKMDQLAWLLINQAEFQRLRRIKQLGFSEFVYPGATHTRFSHSIGVFHNARRLLDIIRKKGEKFDDDRALTAGCAALLHDIGHGPFSHAFEGAQKQWHKMQAANGDKAKLGKFKKHEKWTEEIILGETEINAALRTEDARLPEKVAKIFNEEEPQDIYSSVVSSQFDADRLDYLRRDRYMTGIGAGDFDYEWLLDCLEVDNITVGQEGDFVEVPGFTLNQKGYRAAEGYLESRVHLYSMVYMHKTTRAAEKMLAALLARIGLLISQKKYADTGLYKGSQLVRFFDKKKPTISDYLALDDFVILSALGPLSSAKDKIIANLARGLLTRKLYKCCDLSGRVTDGGNEKQRFQRALKVKVPEWGLETDITLIEDDPKIEGYHGYGWEDETALKKVLIRDSEQTGNTIDIAEKSGVVQVLMKEQEKIYRVYIPTTEDKAKVEKLWREIAG